MLGEKRKWRENVIKEENKYAWDIIILKLLLFIWNSYLTWCPIFCLVTFPVDKHTCLFSVFLWLIFRRERPLGFPQRSHFYPVCYSAKAAMTKHLGLRGVFVSGSGGWESGPGRSWGEGPSWPADATSSLRLHMASPPGSHHPGVSSSCKDSSPMTIMTSSNLDRLLKTPASKSGHMEGRACHCEVGRSPVQPVAFRVGWLQYAGVWVFGIERACEETDSVWTWRLCIHSVDTSGPSVSSLLHHPGLQGSSSQDIPLQQEWLSSLVKEVTLAPWKESYDKPRQHIKKQRHYSANKGPSGQGYGFSSGHVWMWELDYKESWALKNWCFWTVVLEKTLESPLDCKEIQPVNPKGNQSWIFIGRNDAEAKTPLLWPPDVKNWLTGKDPDAGK